MTEIDLHNLAEAQAAVVRMALVAMKQAGLDLILMVAPEGSDQAVIHLTVQPDRAVRMMNEGLQAIATEVAARDLLEGLKVEPVQ